MRMKSTHQSRSMQRGAALAIGLVLLAVASMVTITSLNTGVMQERMAANQDNHARAFMAAEAGGVRLREWLSEPSRVWPTNVETLSAFQVMGEESNVRANDTTITFQLENPRFQTLPDPRLGVEVLGRAKAADGTVLAQTRLWVELERRSGGGPTQPQSANAPAAISCIGGPCSITAGSGGGANEGFGTVSGFNHPIPPLDCSGGGCRMGAIHRTPPPPPPAPQPTITPAVPAVFLTNRTDSSVGVQGGGNKTPSNEDTTLPFQGLDPSDPSGERIVRGTGIAVAHSPPPSTTPPTLESFFPGNVVPTQTVLESGRTTMAAIGGSNVEVGTLVLNGQNLTMQGNALFVGLIVIRDCGTLRMGGNPNIYGAVIVDATQPNPTNPTGPRISCGTNYDPFDGAGTPAVRYSRDALNRAANPPPPPGTGTGTGKRFVEVVRWVEIIQ